MSKGRRASPTRGLRDPAPAPKAAPKRPAFDQMRVATEIVAALADAVVVTGTDRRILTANRAAGGLFRRPPQKLPRPPISDQVPPADPRQPAQRDPRAVGG